MNPVLGMYLQRGGGLRFSYYFTNSGAHNQLLVNKITTENKIVPSGFNNLKQIKKERKKERKKEEKKLQKNRLSTCEICSHIENVIGKYPAVVFCCEGHLMTCNWYFFAQTSLIHVYWKDTNANMECKHQYDLDSSQKGHFRVVSSFCFKARLSAKPLIRKLFFDSCK